MNDKKNGSDHGPQNDHEKNRSVLDKAINAVAEAFKNGSAETTMAHWPDIGVESTDGRAQSETRGDRGDQRDRGATVTYTFEPVEKLEKNGKNKKKKKKKKEKKKQQKLEKKLEKKLKKKEKKARKKLKKEGKHLAQELAGKTEHGFNEAGPYGPGGI